MPDEDMEMSKHIGVWIMYRDTLVTNILGLHPFYRPRRPLGRGIALLFSRTFGTRWGGGVGPTPRPPLPPGKARYPLYRRLVGLQGRSERVENFVPKGIRSRCLFLVIFFLLMFYLLSLFLI